MELVRALAWGRIRCAGLAMLTILAACAVQAPAAAQETDDAPLAQCAHEPVDAPGACSGPLKVVIPRVQSRPYVVGVLPDGIVGQYYREPVIRGGAPGYDIFGEKCDRPSNLCFTARGMLEGVPAQAGTFHLHLVARDQAAPSTTVAGDWTLVIRAPPAPHVRRRRRPVAPPPPPPPPPPEPALALALPAGQIEVYRLTAATLMRLEASADFAPLVATSGKAATPPDCAAPEKQNTLPLSAALQCVVNVEYPSRTLFVAAALDRLREDQAQGADGRDESPELGRRVATLADASRRIVDFGDAKRELRWAGYSNCDCVPPTVGDYRTVYGFFPFWRSTVPAEGEPKIAFSLFDRLGFLGVQLTDQGGWLKPHARDYSAAGWWDGVGEFSRAAHSHRTALDLVLQRSDWRNFLKQNNTPEMLQKAADDAAAAALRIADAPSNDSASFARRFLAPFWKPPRHVFDGVTVMFVPPGPDDPDQVRFGVFFDEFITALIRDMQRNKRAYALNIAVEQTSVCGNLTSPALCRGGPYGLDNLLRFKHMAEPQKHTPPLPPQEEDKGLYQGTTDISLHYLLFLHQSVSYNKKLLRWILDQLENKPGEASFEGNARVTLLRSIIPVLFEPGGEPASPPSGRPAQIDRDRLAKDLAYFHDNFGGVGFWPTPTQIDTGQEGAVEGEIRKAYFPSTISHGQSLWALLHLRPFCSTLIRLLWQAGVLAILVAVGFIAIGDVSDRTRTLIERVTIVFSAVMIIFGFLLLIFDPALTHISQDKWLLLALLLGAVAVGGILAMVPRVNKP